MLWSAPLLRRVGLTHHRCFPGALPLSPQFSSKAVLSEAQFHVVADHTLELLTHSCEGIQQQVEQVDMDVEMAMGVLNITIPGAGTFVVNKQTPNRQLWLSSPISGPWHYGFVEGDNGGTWICTRDQHELFARLSEEFSKVLAISVVLRTDGSLVEEDTQ